MVRIAADFTGHIMCCNRTAHTCKILLVAIAVVVGQACFFSHACSFVSSSLFSLLHCSLDSSPYQEMVETLLSLEVNQKLGLCHACVEQGSWDCARQVFTRLPPLVAMWSSHVVRATCELLHYKIEPLYRRSVCQYVCKCFVFRVMWVPELWWNLMDQLGNM